MSGAVVLGLLILGVFVSLVVVFVTTLVASLRFAVGTAEEDGEVSDASSAERAWRRTVSRPAARC